MGCVRNSESCLILASLFLAQFLSAGSIKLTFKEGQDALVEFTFRFVNPNDAAIEIWKDSSVLFDKTGEENLNAQQANRIKMSMHAKGVDSVVRLSIDNITREDDGAYLCVLYDRYGTTVLETQSNYISVDFPSGPARCTSVAPSDFFHQNYLGSDETLMIISCLVTMGTEASYIACFNPDSTLLPLSIRSNGTHLRGMFWAKKDVPAFCCSAMFENGVDKCNCMEYKSHKEEFLCSPFPTTIPNSQYDTLQSTAVSIPACAPGASARPPANQAIASKGK
ncbi:uncharacterized protein [Diadema setosum]|uniref:uncharacterized protein n=1 Tax=Diadema setosum TaxID=31175 RepID=UPI003B3B4A64